MVFAAICGSSHCQLPRRSLAKFQQSLESISSSKGRAAADLVTVIKHSSGKRLHRFLSPSLSVVTCSSVNWRTVVSPKLTHVCSQLTHSCQSQSNHRVFVGGDREVLYLQSPHNSVYLFILWFVLSQSSLAESSEEIIFPSWLQNLNSFFPFFFYR